MVNSEWEICAALAGRAWQPMKPVQFPRNSSFVIICASQVEAYSAGREKLPQHLRSKNDSTLVSRASSRKFIQISPAENQTPLRGSSRAAAPASSPPHGHPQKGWKPQRNTSGPAQSVEAAPWKLVGKELCSCPCRFASHTPQGRGRGCGKPKPEGQMGRKGKVPDGSCVSKQGKIHLPPRGKGEMWLHTAPCSPAWRWEHCLSTDTSTAPPSIWKLLHLIGSPVLETSRNPMLGS